MKHFFNILRNYDMKKKFLLIIIATLFVGVSLFGEVLFFTSASYDFSLSKPFQSSNIIEHDNYTMTEDDSLGLKLESGFKIKISKNGYFSISFGYFSVNEKYGRTVEINRKTFDLGFREHYNNYFVKLYPEYRWGKDDQFSFYLGFGLNYCDKDKGFSVNKIDGSVLGGFNYIINAEKDLNVTIGFETGYFYLYKNFSFFAIGIGIEKKIL